MIQLKVTVVQFPRSQKLNDYIILCKSLDLVTDYLVRSKESGYNAKEYKKEKFDELPERVG